MSRRIERLNSLIRQEMSELLQRHVKDPRLSGFVTVTQVSVSQDLRHARVMVSVMGSEKEEDGVFVALAAASGFLRKEMSKRLDLRHTPELSFHRDESISQGAQVLRLISQVATTETGEKGPGEC
ncbi:MAG: ribosome-binding factor A [Chloroflexi bacterium RBG_13_54_8]|nr:MAG: ribosome-binding factor A [Chloroflexi bacterium RBG_13_54_8]